MQEVALQEDEVATPGSGIVNVTLQGVFTPDELVAGTVFKLSDYSIGALPSSRVIVSEVASTALGSHVGSNLMVSANIFNTGGSLSHYLESGVQNSDCLLYTSPSPRD